MASDLGELRTRAFFWLMLWQSQPSNVLRIWSSWLLFSQNPEDWTLPSLVVLVSYYLLLFTSALKTGTAAMVTRLLFLHHIHLSPPHLAPPYSLLLPLSPTNDGSSAFLYFRPRFYRCCLVFLSLPYVIQLKALQFPSFSCITSFFLMAELYFLCTHYISFMHAFVDGYLDWILLFLD